MPLFPRERLGAALPPADLPRPAGLHRAAAALRRVRARRALPLGGDLSKGLAGPLLLLLLAAALVLAVRSRAQRGCAGPVAGAAAARGAPDRQLPPSALYRELRGDREPAPSPASSGRSTTRAILPRSSPPTRLGGTSGCTPSPARPTTTGRRSPGALRHRGMPVHRRHRRQRRDPSLGSALPGGGAGGPGRRSRRHRGPGSLRCAIPTVRTTWKRQWSNPTGRCSW